MNPNRNKAHLHTMVLSENKPSNVLNFEEKVDSFIRKNVDFGDVEEVSFTTDRYNTKSGELLVIQWKNPIKNRLDL